ncbi:MAG TPA: hypothetical protein VF527_05965 [Pyrinomonadaceae bacterium]|jgi:hypothetical protein
MKRSTLSAFAFLIVALLSFQIASAQFPRLPKIPKPDRPKPQPTPAATQTAPAEEAQPAQPAAQPASRTESRPAAAASQSNEPTIAKDSVQLTAFTYNVYKGNYDTWSWVPLISYRVNGPIPSGGQLYVEYTVPGNAAVKFDCETGETSADRWWKTTCGGREGVPEAKATTYTGPFQFAIKLRNELAGTDKTIFTGKAKVAKVHSNEISTGKFANHFVYYVDHDWNLPIGYVYYTPDDLNGMKRPMLNVTFWVRGDAYKLDPHLFYKGAEVGRITYEGTLVGKPSCESDVENNTTHFVDEKLAPQKAKWSRVRCTFNNVRAWDTSDAGWGFGAPHLMNKNPGEYEMKVLWNNKLARSVKFTVKPDGTLDTSLAAANKLGTDRVIVPVQIIGEQDGTWDRMAWKTEAFYGHPLTGFTALP